jgi:hypothetical protein
MTSVNVNFISSRNGNMSVGVEVLCCVWKGDGRRFDVGSSLLSRSTCI